MKNGFIFTIYLFLIPINLKSQITVFRYPSPVLYKYCNNPVLFTEVCDRQIEVDYVFEGGKIEISDNNRLHIRLFPMDDSCFLTIFEPKKGFNQFIMRMKCKVLEPPAPYIEVKPKNKSTAFMQDTLNLKVADTLMIKVIPDPQFAFNLPNEIQYRPEKIIIELLPNSINKQGNPPKTEQINILNKWENNQVEWVIPLSYLNTSFILYVNDLHRTDSQSNSKPVSSTFYFENSRKIVVHIK
ncbi:MAG: hypothetical protein K1X92_00560 [Bacteroidia bacterium]|nr:hypothetical protein [Bacteroidia bacterium]